MLIGINPYHRRPIFQGALLLGLPCVIYGYFAAPITPQDALGISEFWAFELGIIGVAVGLPPGIFFGKRDIYIFTKDKKE